MACFIRFFKFSIIFIICSMCSFFFIVWGRFLFEEAREVKILILQHFHNVFEAFEEAGRLIFHCFKKIQNNFKKILNNFWQGFFETSTRVFSTYKKIFSSGWWKIFAMEKIQPPPPGVEKRKPDFSITLSYLNSYLKVAVLGRRGG